MYIIILCTCFTPHLSLHNTTQQINLGALSCPVLSLVLFLTLQIAGMLLLGWACLRARQDDKMSTGTCSHIGLKENHFRDFPRPEHEGEGLKMKLCCLHHRDTVTASLSGRGPDECIRRRPPKGCGFFHFVMRFLLVSRIVTRVS